MLRKSASIEQRVLQMPVRRNSTDGQPPENTPPSISARRVANMLDCTRERIANSFLAGSSLDSLRVGYQLPLADLGNVLREEMRSRLSARRAA